jgi:hypothetical protein
VVEGEQAQSIYLPIHRSFLTMSLSEGHRYALIQSSLWAQTSFNTIRFVRYYAQRTPALRPKMGNHWRSERMRLLTEMVTPQCTRVVGSTEVGGFYR